MDDTCLSLSVLVPWFSKDTHRAQIPTPDYYNPRNDYAFTGLTVVALDPEAYRSAKGEGTEAWCTPPPKLDMLA